MLSVSAEEGSEYHLHHMICLVPIADWARDGCLIKGGLFYRLDQPTYDLGGWCKIQVGKISPKEE